MISIVENSAIWFIETEKRYCISQFLCVRAHVCEIRLCESVGVSMCECVSECVCVGGVRWQELGWERYIHMQAFLTYNCKYSGQKCLLMISYD